MATGRTLEDTVADLLRPMLRDWLDANMPRIVEKALRVELAANAQRSAKPDQN
jgi:cell pole-organizing protein PopZ